MNPLVLMLLLPKKEKKRRKVVDYRPQPVVPPSVKMFRGMRVAAIEEVAQYEGQAHYKVTGECGTEVYAWGVELTKEVCLRGGGALHL